MATFALIHGAGDVGWYWHLVDPELRLRGHDVVAPDLPCDDESAGLSAYADTVVARSETDATRRGRAVVRRLRGAASATGWRRAARARRRADPVTRRGRRGLVDEHRLRADPGRVVRRRGRDLLPRRSRPSWPSRRSSAGASSRPRRRASPGRWAPGPTFRRASSSVATTASSRPGSSVASRRSAWGSCPTRSTAGTASPSATRRGSRSDSTPTRRAEAEPSRFLAPAVEAYEFKFGLGAFRRTVRISLRPNRVRLPPPSARAARSSRGTPSCGRARSFRS